ncbi:hypothetical protein [Spongiactinospora gelatinilytica]|uniref:hypothetical protein n=1 Tax=Spongiactinospora gelatinilytica TaxID=2666298 RepID=UPI0011B9377F|nr:hypothetical protein [Spongiactinospora gelatinilytica]
MQRATDPIADQARRLTAAFVRRLTEEGHRDPGQLAAELVVMARGHGWRPIAALQRPSTSGGGSEPDEDFRAQRAALDRRRPCTCGDGVLDHRLDGPRRTACSACPCGQYAPVPEGSA